MFFEPKAYRRKSLRPAKARHSPPTTDPSPPPSSLSTYRLRLPYAGRPPHPPTSPAAVDITRRFSSRDRARGWTSGHSTLPSLSSLAGSDSSTSSSTSSGPVSEPVSPPHPMILTLHNNTVYIHPFSIGPVSPFEFDFDFDFNSPSFGRDFEAAVTKDGCAGGEEAGSGSPASSGGDSQVVTPRTPPPPTRALPQLPCASPDVRNGNTGSEPISPCRPPRCKTRMPLATRYSPPPALLLPSTLAKYANMPLPPLPTLPLHAPPHRKRDSQATVRPSMSKRDTMKTLRPRPRPMPSLGVHTDDDVFGPYDEADGEATAATFDFSAFPLPPARELYTPPRPAAGSALDVEKLSRRLSSITVRPMRKAPPPPLPLYRHERRRGADLGEACRTVDVSEAADIRNEYLVRVVPRFSMSME